MLCFKNVNGVTYSLCFAEFYNQVLWKFSEVGPVLYNPWPPCGHLRLSKTPQAADINKSHFWVKNFEEKNIFETKQTICERATTVLAWNAKSNLWNNKSWKCVAVVMQLFHSLVFVKHSSFCLDYQIVGKHFYSSRKNQFKWCQLRKMLFLITNIFKLLK